MAIVRVKKDVACVVFDAPDGPLTLRPNDPHDTADWIYKRHPEFFQVDADAFAAKRVTSVRVGGDVEDASAEPGARRNR